MLLGRLGNDVLQQRRIGWKPEPRNVPGQGCLYFQQTTYSVCDEPGGSSFKTYWQTHGLEFDGRRGVVYNESLALFGLPLTGVRVKTNTSGDLVQTQWFERARFEWHSGRPQNFQVLLGLLGNETRLFGAPTNLPLNTPWVRSGNQITALTSSLPTLGIPYIGAGPSITVAPNGQKIAYPDLIAGDQEYVLVVVDVSSGARRSFRLGENTMLFARVFSPDGQQLALTLISDTYPTRYEIRILDLNTGTMNTRLQGVNEPVPVPIAWNSGGLFATKVIYALDAQAQGLYQVGVENGSLQTISESSNLSLEMSYDGRQTALVAGRSPYGQSPKSTLSVLDRASGRQTTLVPESQLIIDRVRWSPDGTKLVYARTGDAGQPVASIHVTNVDGSDEQVLQLNSGAFTTQLHDLAWRNSSSLLLLMGDGQQLVVYEVSLSNLTPAAAVNLQNLRAFREFGHDSIYVPR